MLPAFRFFILGLCCMLSLLSCIRDDSPSGEEGIRVGDKLPEFAVYLDDGSRLTCSDLSGKVSVLVFFHTGCPDCRQELPVIQKLYDYYRDMSSVNIVCISREEPEAEVGSYWLENGFTMPYSAQPDRKIYSLFSEKGVPRVYVSDKNLTVCAVYSDNPIATFEQLMEDVEACLK